MTIIFIEQQGNHKSSEGISEKDQTEKNSFSVKRIAQRAKAGHLKSLNPDSHKRVEEFRIEAEKYQYLIKGDKPVKKKRGP